LSQRQQAHPSPCAASKRGCCTSCRRSPNLNGKGRRSLARCRCWFQVIAAVGGAVESCCFGWCRKPLLQPLPLFRPCLRCTGHRWPPVASDLDVADEASGNLPLVVQVSPLSVENRTNSAPPRERNRSRKYTFARSWERMGCCPPARLSVGRGLAENTEMVQLWGSQGVVDLYPPRP